MVGVVMTGLLFDDLYREPLVAPKPKSGAALKSEGIAKAVNAKLDAVAYARELACDIARARPDGCCSMVDVNAALEREGKPGLGNASAGVFAGHVWEWTGERVKDPRPQAHSNEVKVWRLKHKS